MSPKEDSGERIAALEARVDAVVTQTHGVSDQINRLTDMVQQGFRDVREQVFAVSRVSEERSGTQKKDLDSQIEKIRLRVERINDKVLWAWGVGAAIVFFASWAMSHLWKS